jgi:hypothetical protein
MDKHDLPIENLDVADKYDFLYEFLRRHRLAVLATANSRNQPEAAVVEFSQLKNLELVFDTYEMFRKYGNLLTNSKVAFVIGWDNATLQYEGEAVELFEPELEMYRAVHLQKFPDAIKFEDYAGMKYFKVLPKWIRYLDVSSIPWKRIELRFN